MVQANWTSLGSPPTGDSSWVPQVVQTIDGRLEVFAFDSQGTLWNTGQSAPNGTWSPWALLAHPPNNQLGDAVVGTNADGHLETFTFDSHGALQHSSQQASGGSWSPWTQFETPTDLSTRRDLTTAQDADGRLVVFGSDSNGVLWLASQVTPGNWGT